MAMLKFVMAMAVAVAVQTAHNFLLGSHGFESIWVFSFFLLSFLLTG